MVKYTLACCWSVGGDELSCRVSIWSMMSKRSEELLMQAQTPLQNFVHAKHSCLLRDKSLIQQLTAWDIVEQI